ncbi:glycerophosphoryl diester phosphodiesterase [Colletotrichum plurivorum]|uniref:Glycerophosphoryl diester phosphodiesterase n=1 Tax=Colletotrichum plurivorum TaxID=2175906 RepID=A0A8H6KNB8_9PEZI|nr:glycerophosphoryl diester phosphodiesterase [Colletotrichum plurivorum]
MASETKPLLSQGISHPSLETSFAAASAPAFTRRRPSSSFPQAIAHRGYKALYPENTLLAFKAALDAGAQALETDLHLTRDGVVVLSHDGDLKRCFGVEGRIRDFDWEELKGLETVREPRQKMPRLEDLLTLLGEEEWRGAWVFLDVKTDDPAQDLLSRVADTLASTPGPVPWNQRVIFGCWNQPYIDTVRSLLPTYPLALISWSPLYARSFLSQPSLSFNMFQKSLVGPLGKKFIRDVHGAERAVFAWTVNDEEWMEWCIKAGVDGVITDEVGVYLDVCRRWKDKDASSSSSRSVAAKDETSVGRARPERGLQRTARLYLEVVGIQVLVAVFTPILMLVARFGVVGPGPRTAKALRL